MIPTAEHLLTVPIFIQLLTRHLLISLSSSFRRANIVDLQLHLAAFMRVFLDGVANVESPFGFDVSRLRTLSEGNAVHHIVAFIVHQFQFDVFLSASHHLACAVVVDFFVQNTGFGFDGPNGANRRNCW